MGFESKFETSFKPLDWESQHGNYDAPEKTISSKAESIFDSPNSNSIFDTSNSNTTPSDSIFDTSNSNTTPSDSIFDTSNSNTTPSNSNTTPSNSIFDTSNSNTTPSNSIFDNPSQRLNQSHTSFVEPNSSFEVKPTNFVAHQISAETPQTKFDLHSPSSDDVLSNHQDDLAPSSTLPNRDIAEPNDSPQEDACPSEPHFAEEASFQDNLESEDAWFRGIKNKQRESEDAWFKGIKNEPSDTDLSDPQNEASADSALLELEAAFQNKLDAIQNKKAYKRSENQSSHIDKDAIVELVKKYLDVNILTNMRSMDRLASVLGWLAAIISFFSFLAIILSLVLGKFNLVLILFPSTVIPLFIFGGITIKLSRTISSLYYTNVKHPLLKAYFNATDTINEDEKQAIKNQILLLKNISIQEVEISSSLKGTYRERSFEFYGISLKIPKLDSNGNETTSFISGQLWIIPLKYIMPCELYITEMNFPYTYNIHQAKEFKTVHNDLNRRFKRELTGFNNDEENSADILNSLNQWFDFKTLQAFFEFSLLPKTKTMMHIFDDNLHIIQTNDINYFKMANLDKDLLTMDEFILDACEDFDEVCNALDIMIDKAGDFIA